MSITICIPTYNQQDYVAATIMSAASQEPRPHEIIVSNDCSTDGTGAILDDLAKKIDTLRVIHQPENLGIGSNVSACLKMAKSDYIVRLDSDDLLLPGYIAELSGALDRYPNAGYAHGKVKEIDENGEENRLRTLFRKEGYQNNEQTLREAIQGYRVAANILMFRREALVKAGYVNEQMLFAEDYYLNVSIADAGFGNVYVPKVLAAYRVWSDSGNQRNRRKKIEIDGLTTVFRERIIPAYQRRGWKMNEITAQQAAQARRHASCLGWRIFTEAEKDDIENALLALSDDTSVRLAIKAYRNGLGFVYEIRRNLLQAVKAGVKKIISR